MNFITDRTYEDVLLGNEKGVYNYTDLNRVESAVAAIRDALLAQGTDLQLTTKTDWAVPFTYSDDNWPTQEQMDRFFSNLKSIREHFAIETELPLSMDYLSHTGANAIEQVLEQAWSILFPTQNESQEHTI